MKTFLLMLASAFCGALLLVAGVYGYFMWQFSRGEVENVRFPPRNEKTVSEAPRIDNLERFYGTHASMSGDLPPGARQTVLAAGAGRIVGTVNSGGKPLQGLRLRLALNGAVMSQWAATGADGRYEIALPYGKYRIDGYEIDSSVANKLLAGKTDGPNQGFSSRLDIAVVEEGRPAKGIDFEYVDPVRKLGPVGEVKLAQPVIVTWEPYPGAAAYRLQLTERREPRDFESHRDVFDWRERPIVTGTSVNLADYKAVLKKDHHYTVDIEALDERKRALSQSIRRVDRMDFRIIE